MDMNSNLEVFSDLSERLNYNIPDFPLYVRKGTLHQFDRYAATCHYHLDLEFILVLNGSMEYFINGQTVNITTGNGIFVNSKRLHYGFSSTRKDCTFIVVAVHPSLLGENTQVCNVYFEDKFGLNTEDFILLNPEIQWQHETLILMNELYEGMHCNNHNPLRLLSQTMSLCAFIGDNIKIVSNHLTDDKSRMSIWKMTEFIHKNYDTKITLDHIATSGAVCRSRCCELFAKYIDQTPNNYLKKYRIQKSCEMLKETNRSISEIAHSCGFQTASYFSYVFRKEICMIPQDFRNLEK